MSLGTDDCARILERIWDDTASLDERAALEFHLLDVLQQEGAEGVGKLLNGFPDGTLGSVSTSASGAEVRFAISRGEGPSLLIVTDVYPESCSVHVAVEERALASSEGDPRHAAFYAVWEHFLAAEPPPANHPDEAERAVYLVALLEAELMNGGFGQYLTNTDGALLEETLECLARVGASETRKLLLIAAELRTEAESFVAAWDDKSEEFSRLDAAFLDAGEDLAGLTADEFLT